MPISGLLEGPHLLDPTCLRHVKILAGKDPNIPETLLHTMIQEFPFFHSALRPLDPPCKPWASVGALQVGSLILSQGNRWVGGGTPSRACRSVTEPTSQPANSAVALLGQRS